MRKTLAVFLLLGTGACASPQVVASRRVVATSASAPTASPVPATRAPATVPAQRPAAAAEGQAQSVSRPVLAAPADDIAMFRGLGSWIDVFDHTDDPATVLPLVRGMAERGTKTLYLETARFSSATDIQFPAALGAAVDEAKALGMRVVAWYPPAFDDLDRDVRRSLAAVNYTSPEGNRFDAFGADIEYTQEVPDHADRSRRAVEYSRRLREGAPAGYPMSAIVIPPTSLEYNPQRWPGFPWNELREHYEVFMVMNYWTARGKDAATANDLTQRNAVETKRLTGRPVHVIGGLGEYADEAQVSAYVRAARESGSLGGGLYDYATTRGEVWDELQALNG
ncbi:MAG: hypothetical protein ACRDKJ_04500 [Actinomycetota bacterium]